jgi:hypothetical protein
MTAKGNATTVTLTFGKGQTKQVVEIKLEDATEVIRETLKARKQGYGARRVAANTARSQRTDAAAAKKEAKRTAAIAAARALLAEVDAEA